MIIDTTNINTIFQDDIAIFKFISVMEYGETNYKLATVIKGLYLDASFKKNSKNNFILSFQVPDNYKEQLTPEYFLTRPTLLIDRGAKILLQNFDTLGVKEYIRTGKFEIEIKGFRGDLDDNIWKQSKQYAVFRFNLNDFNPSNSGVIFDMTTKK